MGSAASMHNTTETQIQKRMLTEEAKTRRRESG